MDSSEPNSGSTSGQPSNWCSVCNVSVEGAGNEGHFESRTHLNRCLQKGIGIAVSGSGFKEGERSSSWCSVCNHALDSVTQAEEHYESRAHLNKCLQRGVGLPFTFASSMPHAGPRFTQAGAGANPSGGAINFPAGSTNFRAGDFQTSSPFKKKLDPSLTSISPKKFPMQSFVRGQSQTSQRMSVPYGGGGYSQDLRSSENLSQSENSWQNTSVMKNGWPYCETCDQAFPTITALSQHCNSAGHMEVKLAKQSQFHGTTDQTRFYQASGHVRAQGQNHGQFFGNQTSAVQDHYRGGNGAQNQGTPCTTKEWRPFSRTVQFLS